MNNINVSALDRLAYKYTTAYKTHLNRNKHLAMPFAKRFVSALVIVFAASSYFVWA